MNIELVKVVLDSEYCIKYNISLNDFLNLYINGKKISDTLYRLGGFGLDKVNNYFMLIKYTEAYYDDNITKVAEEKPHLAYQWCILDNNGNEKVCFKQFEQPYFKGGLIYSLANKYYNIETGECYGWSASCFDSEEFIFINDITLRRVLKINKNNGTYEAFN